MQEGVNWGFFDKFMGCIDKYLPDKGEGETFATQIVTAVNKLIYKWYNDGDVYDNSYYLSGWLNDLSDHANWLYRYIPSTRCILLRIQGATRDSDYEYILKDLADDLLFEGVLRKYDTMEKKGTIYDCKGQFKYVENPPSLDDDEEFDDNFDEDDEEM